MGSQVWSSNPARWRWGEGRAGGLLFYGQRRPGWWAVRGGRVGPILSGLAQVGQLLLSLLVLAEARVILGLVEAIPVTHTHVLLACPPWGQPVLP